MQLVESPSTPTVVAKYARPEYARGSKFHSDFLRRLDFVGKRALDAGCGVGNWSLALSGLFEEVVALEYDAGRLAFTCEALRVAGATNVTPLKGSIEKLPFPDASFDCVFCNGVLFVTDWRKSLDELVRVLKPNGKIYITYDTLAWWDHLIFERSAAEPLLIHHATRVLLNQAVEILDGIDVSMLGHYGRWMLVRTLIETALESGPSANVNQKRAAGSVRWMFSKLWLWFVFFAANAIFVAVNSRAHTSKNYLNILGQRPQDTKLKLETLGSAIWRIANYGSTSQWWTLFRKLRRLLTGRSPEREPEPRRGYSLESWQLMQALKDRKLMVLGDAPEAQLNLADEKISVRSIYPVGLGVREIVGAKPSDVSNAKIDMKFLRDRGRWASRTVTLHAISPLTENLDSGYDAYLGSFYTELASSFGGRYNFKDITTELASDSNGADDTFSRIYRFAQDSVFHHPTVQLRSLDHANSLVEAKAVLLSGIGRCGQVSALTAALFRSAGWLARPVQLYRHLCTEVQVDGRWVLVDTDAFKAGIRPRTGNDKWATLDDVRENPAILDRLPSIGHQLSSEGAWARDQLGRLVGGYVDTGLAWERPYLSYIYFGGPLRSPPRPPQVAATCTSGTLRIALSDIDPATARLELWVGRRSRGWSYLDYPDERYLQRPDGSLLNRVFERNELERSIDIPVGDGPVFINVAAADAYQVGIGGWTWPGEEVRIGDAEQG